MTVQERLFGSKVKRVTLAYKSNIDGTRSPITQQSAPAVTLSEHDVIMLLQRELKRDLVDLITIIAV